MSDKKPFEINPDLGKTEAEQQDSSHVPDNLNMLDDNPLTSVPEGEEQKEELHSGGNKSKGNAVNPELGEVEEKQQEESMNEGEGSILLPGFDENE